MPYIMATAKLNDNMLGVGVFANLYELSNRLF